ncbi:MAG: DsbA family protein [Nocardiaceae bacterium]|nr:DsbA family protein [Nocardiaceae bacterium]
MGLEFAVTWDYRCPFARNVNEQILTGLAAGAPWTVTFLPFSLGQAHVDEGQPDVWDNPEQDSGILALQAGVIVRDEYPEFFPAVHRALFALRHDDGKRLRDRAEVERVLEASGAPSAEVFALIDSGDALARVRKDHERYAESHGVWGVPTFIAGDAAVFVRLYNRAPLGSDPAESIRSIERVVDMVTGWTDLNEFKHTRLPR